MYKVMSSKKSISRVLDTFINNFGLIASIAAFFMPKQWKLSTRQANIKDRSWKFVEPGVKRTLALSHYRRKESSSRPSTSPKIRRTTRHTRCNNKSRAMDGTGQEKDYCKPCLLSWIERDARLCRFFLTRLITRQMPWHSRNKADEQTVCWCHRLSGLRFH